MLSDLPLRPFLPGEYRIALADAEWERRGHHALRRAVFCEEQAIFADDDHDEIDRVAQPIVASTCVLGAPHHVVGAVRIHEESPGLWWGSRLAVHRDHRRIGRIGAELIQLAVCTANARGCHTFLAYVQAQNAPFFARLHWRTQEIVPLHGRPHHRMIASLSHYPPHGRSETRFIRSSGLSARRQPTGAAALDLPGSASLDAAA